MEESIKSRMQELRLICEREISIQEQRANNAKISFHASLQSIKLNAEQAATGQAKLGQLKGRLRELEDELVKALAVKTRKEAKHMTISDSISAVKSRTEEIQKALQDQKARKDEYAVIQSHAMETLEQGDYRRFQQKQDIEEAISWYSRVLGFRIEGGHGVKFIFCNINLKNPYEEYSFTIRHSNDTYTLLDCDPHLDDTKGLIKEMNQTNGLFKFARIMRQKFQAVASNGVQHRTISMYQDSSTISGSAPASSISVNENESPTMEKLQAQTKEISSSGSSLRRSSRSKVQKRAN